jgi:hypothetical protein
MTLFLISLGLIAVSALGLAGLMADAITERFLQSDWSDKVAGAKDSEESAQ